MKSLIAALALTTLLLPAAASAQDYTEEQCVADMTKLDANSDGFVMPDEMPSFETVRANVDTNNDGRISAEERTVVCKDSSLRQQMQKK